MSDLDRWMADYEAGLNRGLTPSEAGRRADVTLTPYLRLRAAVTIALAVLAIIIISAIKIFASDD